MLTRFYSHPWHVSDIYAALAPGEMLRWLYFQDEYAIAVLEAEVKQGFSYLDERIFFGPDEDFMTEGKTLDDFVTNPKALIIVPGKMTSLLTRWFHRFKALLGLYIYKPTVPEVLLDGSTESIRTGI